jgi:hypothetical protein
MTGHGSEALTDRYSHVATGEKQKALGALVQLVSAAHSPRDGGPRGGTTLSGCFSGLPKTLKTRPKLGRGGRIRTSDI